MQIDDFAVARNHKAVDRKGKTAPTVEGATDGFTVSTGQMAMLVDGNGVS